jgi:hypothetical protein
LRTCPRIHATALAPTARTRTNRNSQRPRALNRERQHEPSDTTDDRDEQRDAAERGEHERVQPLRRQHFGSDVLERRRPLDRQVGGELRMVRVTDGTSA